MHISLVCNNIGIQMYKLYNYEQTELYKQAINLMNGLCVSWLCFLSFRVEVKKGKDTNIVSCK